MWNILSCTKPRSSQFQNKPAGTVNNSAKTPNNLLLLAVRPEEVRHEKSCNHAVSEIFLSLSWCPVTDDTFLGNKLQDDTQSEEEHDISQEVSVLFTSLHCWTALNVNIKYFCFTWFENNCRKTRSIQLFN